MLLLDQLEEGLLALLLELKGLDVEIDNVLFEEVGVVLKAKDVVVDLLVVLQELLDLDVPRIVDRALALAVGDVDAVRQLASTQEQLDRLQMRVRGRDVEGRVALVVLRLDVDAGLHFWN